MVEAGFGLALLPESSVDEELRAGTLRALNVPAIRVTLPVVLIHRRRAYLSGAARGLMALLSTKPIDRLPTKEALSDPPDPRLTVFAGTQVYLISWHEPERFGPVCSRRSSS